MVFSCHLDMLEPQRLKKVMLIGNNSMIIQIACILIEDLINIKKRT